MPTSNLIKFLQEKMLKLSNNEFNIIIMVALNVWNRSNFVLEKNTF